MSKPKEEREKVGHGGAGKKISSRGGSLEAGRRKGKGGGLKSRGEEGGRSSWTQCEAERGKEFRGWNGFEGEKDTFSGKGGEKLSP